MKVIQIHEAGDANVLKMEELPIPTPKAGEALIRVKAAGLNFIDIYQRSGRYPTPTPFIPGREAAGIVEAVGPGVTHVKPGDRVAYLSDNGSYAEFNIVKALQLILLPNEITFEQGAAFPLQGMTAHYLVNDFYPIEPGTTVLVHAAAGGVGLLLVQWLKHLGARVIGTVSTKEKADIAYAAGADEVILYTKSDFVAECKKLTNEQGVDYILDGVGKDTFTKDLDTVRTRGWVCLYGSSSGPADPFPPNSLQAKSITLTGATLFNYIATEEELTNRSYDVLNAMREGWLKLKIDYVYPLDQAAKAQEMLESRKTTGKVILKIGD